MQGNKEQNFHEFALQTSLFKGQSHLYFCYLKSERLAAAIKYILRDYEALHEYVLNNLPIKAQSLPGVCTQLAFGFLKQQEVLAHVFEVLTLLRLAVAQQFINEENGGIIIREYELIARKIAIAPSPLLTLQDLAISELPESPIPTTVAAFIKDEYKGQNKDIRDRYSKRQNTNRTDTILKIIDENKKVSIKDISKIVRDCSEKTIQRELISLIEQGFIRKEGKKRWSTYVPA